VEEQHPAESVLADEVLVARVASRDRTAFAVIYDRYARTVYALAAHLLGGIDAYEIVQDVYLQLRHRAGQFEADRGSFRAWFITMVRHTACSMNCVSAASTIN
jgi:RNA polymerase sigma-70 factor (ECF subfamily)